MNWLFMVVMTYYTHGMSRLRLLLLTSMLYQKSLGQLATINIRAPLLKILDPPLLELQALLPTTSVETLRPFLCSVETLVNTRAQL